MEAEQFAWLYLIQHGHGGQKASGWGGFDFENSVSEKYPRDHKRDGVFGYEKYVTDILRAEIKRIGVDWKKTAEPETDYLMQFEGTDADSTRRNFITGVLILKDGSKQRWSANSIEITGVFKMMAAVSKSAVDFKEVFGDDS